MARRFPDSVEDADATRLSGRIRETEAQIAQLLQARQQIAPPSAERNTDHRRADLLRGRMHHLLEIIERNAAQCRQLQREAQDALRELQRGGQFLQGVRGYRENQPKFLDSRNSSSGD